MPVIFFSQTKKILYLQCRFNINFVLVRARQYFVTKGAQKEQQAWRQYVICELDMSSVWYSDLVSHLLKQFHVLGVHGLHKVTISSLPLNIPMPPFSSG